MQACPACGGEPYTAFGFNPATGRMDQPQACNHLCPARATAGDYSTCLCCEACMKSAYICGSISDTVTPAGSPSETT